jgi:16S rRNA (cytosine1402-N4)-methyltransferase
MGRRTLGPSSRGHWHLHRASSYLHRGIGSGTGLCAASWPAGREFPFSTRLGPLLTGEKTGAMLAKGLRMSHTPETEHNRSYEHVPVMLQEVVGVFSAVPEGTVLDATVGGAGHARALLEARPDLRLVGLDRDGSAVEAARSRLATFGERAQVVKERFDRLGQVLDQLGVPVLSGALFDLGVSSPQLDQAGRGFSYRSDAPLDMRMDQSQRLTAAHVVNEWGAEELASLFRDHGEGRFARRIAGFIVEARPLQTTAELVRVVERAVPLAARRRGHVAKRVFQALRVAVNSELDVLPTALDQAIARLVPGGRLVAISYHSGEDRTVKARLAVAATGGCTCPPGLPCVCGAVPRVRLLNRGARMPSANELALNPRAGSARLRAAEALGQAGGASSQQPGAS